MKKRVYGRKLSRGSGARRALFRSLIRALVSEGSIVTTEAKAKIIKQYLEKMVSLAKRGGVSRRRRVFSTLGNDRKTTDSLFNIIAPAFGDRKGGYLRITKLPRRRGDAAKIARLEWVKEVIKSGEKKVDTTKKEGKKTETTKKPRIRLPRRKSSESKKTNKK